MSPRDQFDVQVVTVALALAAKGYRAEHPGAAEDESLGWAKANVRLYLEDALAFLEDLATTKRG